MSDTSLKQIGIVKDEELQLISGHQNTHIECDRDVSEIL